MNRYKLVLLLLLFSCHPTTEHPDSGSLTEESKTNEHKFYDFDFEFTKYFSPVGVSERFVLKNSEANSTKAFKENHLYYIRYADQDKVKELPKPDTTVVELDKKDLDSLYLIASEYMKLKYSTNVSPFKVLPPPVAASEWEHAEIILDLGLRGDKYSVSTGQFDSMYQYLKRMKSKPQMLQSPLSEASVNTLQAETPDPVTQTAPTGENSEYSEWQSIRINGNFPPITSVKNMDSLLGKADSVVTIDWGSTCSSIYRSNDSKDAYYRDMAFEQFGDSLDFHSVTFNDDHSLFLQSGSLRLSHATTLEEMKKTFPKSSRRYPQGLLFDRW